MSLQWFDWIGFAGVALIVLAYLLVQVGQARGDGFGNQMLNALGAVGVIVSLLFGAFNFPALVLESVWLLISIYGMVRGVRRRRSARLFR